ncbi:hypothetical protein [Streptomyces sp. NBC_00989]|uniref:hypothetical protein n=1 Tax=Streptomyces sp. NBC_00989 TaxID=2903705 RepID=UPI00386BC6DA|nr:hypothetical protein OG714_20390 [Streptomyces sp. NBC_00989]
MADEDYRWLDRETAERLLHGESVEAVDPAAREQAERLAKTLGALSVDHSLGKVELPGEDAALAAFRAVRTGNDVERATLGRRGRPHSSDAGLVRLGRPVSTGPGPRWARPVRFGLTAALGVGMLGGVAVAAATGVLPTPFHDDPAPAASISAAVTPPDRTLVSPSPSGTGGPGTPTTGGGGSDGSSGEAAGSGTNPTPSAGSGDGKSFGSGGWWSGVTSSCRAVRDGKPLAPGRKRTLEGAAGGTSHVWTYCKGLLERAGSGTDTDEKGAGGKGTGNGSGIGKNGGAQGGDQNDSDEQVGGQGGGGDGHIAPIAPGGSGGSGGSGSGGSGGGRNDNDASGASVLTPLIRPQSASTPVPSHTTTARQTPSPSPTYSAL